jgi:hypothetical protein
MMKDTIRKLPENQLGQLQRIIVNDSNYKKVFAQQDLARYYKNFQKANLEFMKLHRYGFFDVGKSRITGEVVYVSRQC